MIIAPDEGRIPWWRLLWSLLGALLIGAVGVIALMTDMNNPGPLHVAIELVSVPFVRPTYYLLGQTSATAISVAVLASFALWWFIIFIVLLRNMRKRNAARPA